MTKSNTNWTDSAKTNTNWSDPTKSNTGWDISLNTRHTYGHEAGKTTRIRYGDHVRYGGILVSTAEKPNTNWNEA